MFAVCKARRRVPVGIEELERKVRRNTLAKRSGARAND
jgi:hypothetical protein